MKIAGFVVDAYGAQVTLDRAMGNIQKGDMLFAAEPGESLNYKRVPSGGIHIDYALIVIWALVFVIIGVAIGSQAF